MKQLILMLAMLALGLTLFTMIAGDKNSIKSHMKEVFEAEISVRTNYP